MSLNIQMSVRKNILLIRLKGELDQFGSNKIKTRVSEVMVKYQIKHLIINFENLSFMDSTGIGFMIGRYYDFKKNGGKVIICSMNNIIKRIFNISGLQKICSVVKNEKEAYEMVGVI